MGTNTFQLYYHHNNPIIITIIIIIHSDIWDIKNEKLKTSSVCVRLCVGAHLHQ